jgi:hypothetical protein
MFDLQNHLKQFLSDPEAAFVPAIEPDQGNLNASGQCLKLRPSLETAVEIHAKETRA